MSVTADATTPGGLGTFGFDDEGVAAQRSPLVVDGVVAGFLTSRETAADGDRVERGDAGRRLGQHAPDPHDQRAPGARAGHASTSWSPTPPTACC